MLRRRNDILWKTILEEVFGDLLHFLYHNADTTYDMSRGFEFLDKELAEMYPEPNKSTDTRFADKLVKVYSRDGQEEWMLVHIEIQGDTSQKQDFAERMFRYFYRIIDKYRKPVSAIAIFTGLDWQKMPDRYEYTCGDTSLVYKYRTLSILDYAEADLLHTDNPFVIVLMAARTGLLEGEVAESFLLQKKLLVARKLFKSNLPKEKVRALYAFLNNYVRLVDPDLNSNFITEVDLLDQKHYNMGIIEYLQYEAKQEGIEEGKIEGLQTGRQEAFEEAREKFTLLLLEDKKHTIDEIAKMLNVSTEFVNNIKDQSRLS